MDNRNGTVTTGTDQKRDQTVAIVIVLMAGLSLLVSSLLFVRRYHSRQQMLASRFPSAPFGPPVRQPSYYTSQLEAGGAPPLLLPAQLQLPRVSRWPEGANPETGEQLPEYKVAAKSPVVLTYPEMVYTGTGRAGMGEPPPYDASLGESGREDAGEPSARRGS
ncbi:hypothetical protein DACRYDRAFT_97509 [Dacryopinax primogenitus]|uniref:Uncharacterized protein n=1 Tax=Dacryopinax primogenitus (strain DJM 731) TaxID=1858805 RepID=M5FU31_DACPD|nr:uncharacterized protein DACRYDRAFT_97509 [Dacryopinax primogenitus]EJT96721.1 hypothetical protein DACRYDRAFT_97509 [Dacryopinax primogenitus]